MAVYVDKVTDYGELVQGQARRYGTRWSHLTADTDNELYQMAVNIRLSRKWAQHMDSPLQFLHHFDLTPTKRKEAIRWGAIETDEDPNMRTYVRKTFHSDPIDASILTW